VEKEKDAPDSSGFDSDSATPTVEPPTIAFPSRPEGHAREAEEPAFFPPLVPGVDQIGSYRLLRVLGEGGFGTVYLAEQTEPLKRQVALKLLHWARRDRRRRRRFEVERQALARMSHPNVAVVYEAGTTQQSSTRAARPDIWIAETLCRQVLQQLTQNAGDQ
jgi:serine/threonine protein kinase